ncbi:hypothetical protein [Bosea sp. 685]|uniref:hypothetical protein n=1 Tax=Bosea sp. 685 TaxID=3080057 RepID=UPI0028937004|nr:hypothetical protein [Bosea sp. 685]WNJ87916.1 hypothetical protein RMR04_00750 [Bosea sp. 685]
MDPALMLFDEPTSALDPEHVGEAVTLLRDLATAGTTMLVVTHEMGFASKVSDRIVAMTAGKVVFDARREDALNGSDNRLLNSYFEERTY